MGHGHALLALFLQLALLAILPAFASAQAQVTQDSQCGGQNWTGPTTCGFHDQTCIFIDQGLSQCLSPGDSRIPASSQPPPPPPPPTSVSPVSHPTPVDTTTSTEYLGNQTSSSIPTTTSDQTSLQTDSSADTQSDASQSPDSSSFSARSTSPAKPERHYSISSTGSPPYTNPPANVPGPSDSAAGVNPPDPSSPASDASPSAPPALGSAKSSNKGAIIAGVLIPLLLIALGVAGVILYKRRQRARDRREWERTHAEIADAVRQVGGRGVSVAGSSPYVGSAWASSQVLRQGSGDTVTDPFVDTYQDAEVAYSSGPRSPFYAEDEHESPHGHAV
ncbi:hypothetical protein B0H19DRAFT_1057420 [Mycena capillaripes]|nr:hypothetical protein B0H19DRAFT_1057420 [Mycena capillaripes]